MKKILVQRYAVSFRRVLPHCEVIFKLKDIQLKYAFGDIN
ncbi:hypothetical protein A33Q_0861 [Indibacter alkaliphilus LW1]|uniref:Uncharacterized protein n=1 Tax=Indibacter alkaliphilus (strain CCUG 57479 / KCTC 22604 / LW1) TaxID=1189612 RepID=S2E3D3_INDAL|nr:hypothetical protein A33Q_0861 [Indibacter alkaliphilus LW1]